MCSVSPRKSLFFAVLLLSMVYLFEDWKHCDFLFLALVGLFVALNQRDTCAGREDADPLI